MAALVAWHFIMAGHTDGLSFPARSLYALPWAKGASYMCAQGNNTRATHSGIKYAGSWDFFMLPGTEIYAARAGIVESVQGNHGDWPGFHAGNMITVRHEDGSLAIYGHLRGRGMKVAPGQSVRQGERIGEAGLSGPTVFPHLHFHVEDKNGNAVAVSFSDIAGSGIPQLWGLYRAGVSP